MITRLKSQTSPAFLTTNYWRERDRDPNPWIFSGTDSGNVLHGTKTFRQTHFRLRRYTRRTHLGHVRNHVDDLWHSVYTEWQARLPTCNCCLASMLLSYAGAKVSMGGGQKWPQAFILSSAPFSVLYDYGQVISLPWASIFSFVKSLYSHGVDTNSKYSRI